jgi:hypothetical protein
MRTPFITMLAIGKSGQSTAVIAKAWVKSRGGDQPAVRPPCGPSDDWAKSKRHLALILTLRPR